MKKIKMMIYGEPGTGKSVFAVRSPRPYFITTDGNYEWLEDFGAKMEDHTQVTSWEEAKKLFASDFKNYDTIVIDLLEDLFKWCEQEFCKRSKIDHVSDIGFAKGYDITRNEFFLEISKLLGKDKNIILISHGYTFTTKDRRGIEHTKHAPSNRLPDKVLDMIEGRLRYCLRCYMKAEEQEDGSLVKKRYLSLVPKENEFGIIRGIDENLIPHDIDLDWNEFTKCIGFDNMVKSEVKVEKTEVIENVVQYAKENNVTLEKLLEKPETKQETNSIGDLPFETETIKEEVNEEVKEESKPVEVKEEVKPLSNADKIAALKAKLAAMKAGNN